MPPGHSSRRQRTERRWQCHIGRQDSSRSSLTSRGRLGRLLGRPQLARVVFSVRDQGGSLRDPQFPAPPRFEAKRGLRARRSWVPRPPNSGRGIPPVEAAGLRPRRSGLGGRYSGPGAARSLPRTPANKELWGSPAGIRGVGRISGIGPRPPLTPAHGPRPRLAGGSPQQTRSWRYQRPVTWICVY